MPTPLKVQILVFDKAENQIRNLNVDLKKKDCKNWVFKLVWWAANNGYSVEFNYVENPSRSRLPN